MLAGHVICVVLSIGHCSGYVTDLKPDIWSWDTENDRNETPVKMELSKSFYHGVAKMVGSNNIT